MKINEKFKSKFKIIMAFIKWFFIAIIVGVVLGTIGTLFHYTIDVATETFAKSSLWLFLLPIVGITIPLLYKFAGMEKDLGTNMAILSIRDDNNLSIKTAPLIFISTVLTHLVGGSSGREGAALQLGSSVAASIGKIFNLDKYDQKIIVMCGMSAAFSALFGTPITAAIFSIEVVGVGIMQYSALVPCTIASVIGSMTASYFKVIPTSFNLPLSPQLTPITFVQIILLSALAAFVSILFCKAIQISGSIYKKIKNPMLRGAIGGIIVLVITLLLGTTDYNGAGMAIITKAISGQTNATAFIIKIILTALTLGAGFKGGEIVPSFFTGATFGCFMAPFLGIDAGFGAGIGLVTVFCGVTNCPVASLLLSLELFHAQGVVFFAIACATGYMLSGYTGLYKEQKIVYSKVKPVFLNQKIK